MPAVGLRNASGTLRYQSTDGYYWSSSVTGSYGYRLYFYSSSSNPASYDVKAGGFSVRCVKK